MYALKNTVTKIENAKDRFHNRSQIPKGITNKMEDRSEHCIEIEQQWEKNDRKNT